MQHDSLAGISAEDCLSGELATRMPRGRQRKKAWFGGHHEQFWKVALG